MFLIIGNPCFSCKTGTDNKALRSALFSSFHASHYFFHHLKTSPAARSESFTSNQPPAKCGSAVTFSLIISLCSPPYTLCKLQPNNPTDLNQTVLLTHLAVVFFFFVSLPLEGGERGDSRYFYTVGILKGRSCLPVLWNLCFFSSLSAGWCEETGRYANMATCSE